MPFVNRVYSSWRPGPTPRRTRVPRPGGRALHRATGQPLHQRKDGARDRHTRSPAAGGRSARISVRRAGDEPPDPSRARFTDRVRRRTAFGAPLRAPAYSRSDSVTTHGSMRPVLPLIVPERRLSDVYGCGRSLVSPRGINEVGPWVPSFTGLHSDGSLAHTRQYSPSAPPGVRASHRRWRRLGLPRRLPELPPGMDRTAVAQSGIRALTPRHAVE
jgi:hypothetical protein